MSYILTALRKSDAERAKGIVPRPSTRHDFEIAPARRGRLWPAVAVAALVFNSLLVAFVLWNPAIAPWSDDQQTNPAGASVAAVAGERPSEVRVAEASTVKTDGSSGDPEPSRVVAPANGTSHTAGGSGQSAQAAQTAAQQVSTAPAGKAPATPSTTSVRGTAQPVQNNGTDAVLAPAAAPAVAELNTVVSSKKVTAPQAETALTLSKTSRTKSQQASGRAASPQSEALAKQTAKAARKAAVRNAAARKPATQIALAPPKASAEAASPVEQASDPYADVPELWRMSRDFRSRVPKFSISVHVYAPEDDHRFIIVDRKKYGEGDRMKSGVTIEAILPGGVVFQVNGEQFKLTSS